MNGLGFNTTPLLTESSTIPPSQWITDVYQALYHRAPDEGGKIYWTDQLQATSRQAVLDSFLSAPEFCMANPTDALCHAGGSGNTGGNSGGTDVANPDSTIIPGIPDNYVYIGAIAVAALIFMSKKRG